MGQCPPNKPWKVVYKDAAGKVVRYKCYDQKPSLDGNDPDSPYQLSSNVNDIPYAQCNCPDSMKQLTYYNANGQIYAQKDWTGSDAGAPEYKGMKMCKHVFATLSERGVLEQFMPKDFFKEPVEIQYQEEGVVGPQDTVWEMQPDAPAQNPEGKKQISKRWI